MNTFQPQEYGQEFLKSNFLPTDAEVIDLGKIIKILEDRAVVARHIQIVSNGEILKDLYEYYHEIVIPNGISELLV